MNIKEILAKSIITKSKLPDADYVINPYTGCQFGCLYCYASFMGRFVNESLDNWGNYLYVKTNAHQLFISEYHILKKVENDSISVLLSSVTDCYQPAEKKYELTRKILAHFQLQNFMGTVSILTKSPLVLRDIDILKNINNVEVGLTVTDTDDRLSNFLESKAPSNKSRLETLTRLNNEGIKTYAFLGPLLPHFRYDSFKLESLIKTIADSGVSEVYVEQMNLKPYILSRVSPQLNYLDEKSQLVYNEAKFNPHRKALQEMILPLLNKYHLKLKLNKVIYHNE